MDCDLLVDPKWNVSMESFTIDPSDLPFCVNNEWDVDPSGKVTASVRGEGTLPYVLHFMAYIPPKDASPLSLHLDAGQTQSFFVPSWGGVHILNKHLNKGSMPPPRGADLNEEDEQSIAEAAVTMLRLSLGFDEMPQEKGISHVRFLEEGFAQNEVEWLVLKKLTQDTGTSVHILLSLVNLVDTIPNLEVPDIIQDQVCVLPYLSPLVDGRSLGACITGGCRNDVVKAQDW